VTTLAVIGAGKLGEALIAGVLASGWAADDITIVEADPARSAQLADQYGVRTSTSITDASTAADVALICVKPQHTGAVTDEIALATRVPLVISVAAGVGSRAYESRLPPGTAVVRVMPNTPALLGAAMSAISAGTCATDADLDLAQQIFGAVGRVVRVPEHQIDAVTAISGSGPAYFFLLAEAMVKAAAAVGLDADIAAELVVQTAYGAAAMLRDSGQDAKSLREAVTSPGGTTAAALGAFERGGFVPLVEQAVLAARDRSLEMGAPSS
jgi:pyrroline-5-carboxylate reductase